MNTAHVAPVKFAGDWKVDKGDFVYAWGPETAKGLIQSYEDSFQNKDAEISGLPRSVELKASTVKQLLGLHSEVIYISMKQRGARVGDLVFDAVYRRFWESTQAFVDRAFNRAKSTAEVVDAE